VAVVLRDADQARAQLKGIVTIAGIVRRFATIRTFLRVDFESTRSYDSRVFLIWQGSFGAYAGAAVCGGNDRRQARPAPETFPDQNRFCGV
jgi:hypothetical protein